MRHVVSFDDSTVAIVTLVPSFIVVEEGGRFAVRGVRRDEVTPGFGFCKLYGDGFELVVGDLTYDIGRIERDSMPGFVFEFPDVFNEIARWPDSLALRVAAVRPLTAGERTPDRLWRAAWTDDGRVMSVDLARARDIWRDKMRAARAPLLPALDTAQLTAVSSTAEPTVKDIEMQKQVLRDVTADPALEQARTPEEITAVWPPVLGTRPESAQTAADTIAVKA